LLRNALSYWQAGEFHLCLHALDEMISNENSFARYMPGPLLLRAKAFIRLGMIEQARDWLTQNSLRFTDQRGDDAATHAMLTGQVFASEKDVAEAERWFTIARRCSPGHRVSSEIEYFRALALYQQGRFESARAQVIHALQTAEGILAARVRSLHGWIAVADESYLEAYRDFYSALDLVGKSSTRDTQLHASILYALAVCEAEVQLGDFARLDNETAKLRWPTSLSGEHTQTLRHLGLAYLHSGDRSKAIAKFIASTEVAPGTPWSMIGFLECANMALSSGEEVGALALIRKAQSLADRHSWKNVTGEQRIPLLMLAQSFSRVDEGDRAKAYRSLYYEHPGVSNMSALGHDTRLLAFERHVEGCVVGAMGMRDNACALLETVREEWLRIKFRWRAEEAKEDARRINPSRDQHPITLVRPQLSIREEQFLRLVVEGKTNEELAEHFHIAKNTVKNMLVKLYEKFDVHSRTQLVVAARHLTSRGRVIL
jgi:DNA-binding NarL/FixJ family response regulator